MYEEFLKSVASSQTSGVVFDGNADLEVRLFFGECGGKTFLNGLYRTHDPSSSLHWADIIGKYFNKSKACIIPFGFDWLGRHYVVDTRKQNQLLMFDPSTAEVSTLQQNITSFHNEDLTRERDAYLSEQFFGEATKLLHVNNVYYSDCVGHKQPLFLNGSDAIDNYEIINMEVYWEFQCQIYCQIKDLPPGTNINSIKFERE